MSEHAATAIDQLRLADSCDTTRGGEHLGFLVKAVVHALLEVAAAVREENAAFDTAMQTADWPEPTTEPRQRTGCWCGAILDETPVHDSTCPEATP